MIFGFPDLAGAWDQSLTFLLGGTIVVSMTGTRLVGRMRKPALAECFDILASRGIKGQLIGRSAMFGVGWGWRGSAPAL